jgi:hypothetical protein
MIDLDELIQAVGRTTMRARLTQAHVAFGIADPEDLKAAQDEAVSAKLNLIDAIGGGYDAEALVEAYAQLLLFQAELEGRLNRTNDGDLIEELRHGNYVLTQLRQAFVRRFGK